MFLTPLPSPIVHPDSHNTIEIHPVGPGGPMITDGNGNLVWFKQLTGPDVAANLQIQKFRGRKVLTWWQGGVTPSAFGIGKGVIANRNYQTIRTVHAGNGYDMDIHEFTLTPGGDALFTVYVPIMVHLPGSPSGTLSPCSTRSCRRSTCAPASWSGSGTPTGTSRSRTPTRIPRTAPPTTRTTSTRFRTSTAVAF